MQEHDPLVLVEILRVEACAQIVLTTARPNSEIIDYDFDRVFSATRQMKGLADFSRETAVIVAEEALAKLTVPDFDYANADRDTIAFSDKVGKLILAAQRFLETAQALKYPARNVPRIDIPASEHQHTIEKMEKWIGEIRTEIVELGKSQKEISDLQEILNSNGFGDISIPIGPVSVPLKALWALLEHLDKYLHSMEMLASEYMIFSWNRTRALAATIRDKVESNLQKFERGALGMAQKMLIAADKGLEAGLVLVRNVFSINDQAQNLEQRLTDAFLASDKSFTRLAVYSLYYLPTVSLNLSGPKPMIRVAFSYGSGYRQEIPISQELASEIANLQAYQLTSIVSSALKKLGTAPTIVALLSDERLLAYDWPGRGTVEQGLERYNEVSLVKTPQNGEYTIQFYSDTENGFDSFEVAIGKRTGELLWTMDRDEIQEHVLSVADLMSRTNVWSA